MLCVAVIGVVLLGVSQVYHQPNVQLSEYQTFAGLNANTRLTIVSPHLDDETLGVGGLIAEARSKGIPVSVIFMTNGDDNPIGADMQFRTGYPTPDQLIKSGEARQQEVLKALNVLGVQQKDIYFLGLPDRSLTTLLSPKYANTPYTAPGTLKNTSPYPLSYIPNLEYTGNTAEQALTQALQESNANLVLTTLSQDSHKDHQATATFVQRAQPANLMYFLIHYHGFPNRDSNQELLPPPNLKDKKWQVVELTPADVEAKRQAVDQYVSQLRIPELGGLMRSMVRNNELLVQ